METIKTKQRTGKAKVAFLSVATLFVSFLVFTSCNDNSEAVNLDDTALVERIDAAAKVVIDDASLPSTTQAIFNGDLNDNYISKVELASELGYKVSVNTVDDSRMEDSSDVYFNLLGRQLDDHRERSRSRRNRCFEFVFPIDFLMPDDSVITLESKDDWYLLRDWCKANPDANEKPEMIFPVDITLADGTVQTLLDRTELDAVKNSCRADRDMRKCFKLVLPITFTMPDNSEITVTTERDFRLIRQWHKDHPDVREKGTLNFPVDIEYRDGTTATIANETEFEAAKQSCN